MIIPVFSHKIISYLANEIMSSNLNVLDFMFDCLFINIKTLSGWLNFNITNFDFFPLTYFLFKLFLIFNKPMRLLDAIINAILYGDIKRICLLITFEYIFNKTNTKFIYSSIF